MSEWQNIESAPPGQYVLLYHRSWRHEWVGRYTGVGDQVVIDNADTAATQTDAFASHWRPRLEPPK